MRRRLVLLWWQGEQSQRKGPDVERSVVKVAGLDWKERAQDRGWWHSRSEDYIQQFNVPWASDKQSQLESLKPNSGGELRCRDWGVHLCSCNASFIKHCR